MLGLFIQLVLKECIITGTGVAKSEKVVSKSFWMSSMVILASVAAKPAVTKKLKVFGILGITQAST